MAGEETIWKLDIQSGSTMTVLRELDTILLSIKSHFDAVSSQAVKAANSFTSTGNSVKSLSTATTSANENVTKLSMLQTKAGEAAKKLEVAEAQAAIALKKADDAANSGKMSAEQVALAQAKASLAAEKVKVAQDNVGLAMQRVTAETNRLASTMAEDAEKTSIFSRALSMARTGLSELASGVQGAIHGMSSLGSKAVEAGGSIISGFRGAISHVVEFTSKIGFAVFGIQQVIQTAMSLGSALLDSNASMEQTQVAFTQLLGSSQAANAELKELQQFAAATPFQFPDLANAVQKLIAFQIPLKDTKPLLTAIGDALSGLGKGTPATLEQVVDVFGQMNAAGKIQTQDLMQLTSVGINGFQILADQMGKPVSVIKDMVTAGLIPADKGIEMLRAGMEHTFGGGMQAQSLTFNGLLSTFKDNIGAAWRAFTGPLFEQAKTGLIKLGDLVSSPAFQQFATDMGTKVGGAIQTVVTFVNTQLIPGFQRFLPIIREHVAPIVNVAIAFGQWITSGHAVHDIMVNLQPIIAYLAPLFRQLGESIVHLGTVIAPIIVHVATWIAQSGILKIILTGIVIGIGMFVQGITLLINGLSSVITFFTTGGSNAKWLWNIFAGIGTFLASTFMPVWQQLVNVWQTQLLPAMQQLVPVGRQIWNALQPLAPLFQFIAGVIVVTIAVIIGVIGGLIGAFAALISGIAQIFGGIVQVISGAIQIIVGIVKFLSDFLRGDWGKLGADLGQIWQGVVTMIAGIWNTIMGIFNLGINVVKGFLSSFVATIIGFFTNLYNVLVGRSIIPDMINGIINWFAQLPGRIFAFILNLVNTALGYFRMWYAAGVTLVQTMIDNIVNIWNSLISKASQILNNVKNTILNGLNFGGQLFSAGAHIVEQIASGITSNISNFLGGAMNSVGQFIHDHLPSSPAKLGPLRELQLQGSRIPQQVAEGIESRIPRLQEAMSSMTTPIATNLSVQAMVPPSSGGTTTSQRSHDQTVQHLATMVSLLSQMVALQRQNGGNGATNVYANPVDARRINQMMQSLSGSLYEGTARGAY